MDLGLRQEDLARRLGIQKDAVQLLETRSVRPRMSTVAKVIRFLGYDPEEKSAKPNGSLAQDLIAYRRRCGLTQAQLAKRLRVNEDTVRYWERGSHHPQPHLLERFRRLSGD